MVKIKSWSGLLLIILSRCISASSGTGDLLLFRSLEGNNGTFDKRDTSDVCGYINGDYYSPDACPAGYSCTVNTANIVYGCCEPGNLLNCDIAVACVPYGWACDAACQANNYIEKCGSTAKNCVRNLAWMPAYSKWFTEYKCSTGIYDATILPSPTNPPATTTPIAAPVIVTVTPTAATTVVKAPDTTSSTEPAGVQQGVTNVSNPAPSSTANSGSGNSQGSGNGGGNGNGNTGGTNGNTGNGNGNSGVIINNQNGHGGASSTSRIDLRLMGSLAVVLGLTLVI